MPLLPPELGRPFATQAGRVAARALLADRAQKLRAIEALARTPADAWPSGLKDAFPTTTNGVPDPPPQRLTRWARLFAEELAEIHRLSQRTLSDIELQEAVYLAGRLLCTVTDRPMSDVDSFTFPS